MILTTNFPFSEWTQVIPNARLCKALIDRITERPHIIETGVESYRFRRTMEKQKEASDDSPGLSIGLRYGRCLNRIREWNLYRNEGSRNKAPK